MFQTGSDIEAGIDDPAVKAAMEKLFAEAAAIEGVAVTTSYEGIGAQTQVNEDRTVAFASVVFATDLDVTETAEISGELLEQVPVLGGLQVEIGGVALGAFEPSESEFVRLSFAVIVLIVAFGSVLAIDLPIGVAVAGVGMGLG